jgi:ABC-type antimicrobial peptide transport system permease subunit
MILSGSISGTHPAPPATQIVATTPSLQQVDNLKVSTGQFLDTSIDTNTAVIGPTLANRLFDTDQPLGQTMTIRGTSFTIIGTLATAGAPLNYNNVDFDSAVLINQSMASSISGGAAQIQQINIEADSPSDIPVVMKEIDKTLLANHLGDRDFSVLSGGDIARPTSQLFYAIAGITAAIAAISLLVGGIGIMNIMLVGVAERTREIGIRKAVGAKDSDIAGQFLVESLALSVGGGIAGYILGYGLAFLISTLLPFDPIFNWQIGVTAFAVSLFVGVIFGVYPAIRASKKDPIISLRYFG